MSQPNPDTFSDHLVFVDESGDHGLARVDPGYPIFVLAFCLFAKSDYVVRIGPALQRLKFELVMTPKTSNSTGLQIADLVARSVGIKVLRDAAEPGV